MTSKPKVSTRARKYVQNKVAGMSDYKAAVAAGYSKNTAVAAKQNIENPSVKKLIQDLMDEMGMSDDHLLTVLRDGLDNANRIFGTGDNFVEVADHSTRHKYLETALKLKDKFPSAKTDITSGGEPLQVIITDYGVEDNTTTQTTGSIKGK
ncbi:MAG: terminase small subunit [Candidatus Roizmanbacteria bacterium]|nr:terminase small subunit [Candidatus Roizmanbacteria bacterium]